MGKEKGRTHELEQYSRGLFLARFSDWVVNSLDEEDYAFDFEVRPTGKFIDPRQVRQSPFFVQLKACERCNDKEEVWYDFATDYLVEDCLSSSIPVVLCLFERRLEQFSWCVLQPYCWDVLDEEKSGWATQTKVRVRFSRDSLDELLGKRELLQAVTQAQRRITMRASIASKRRRTFAHPPGTMLASTEEVRTHKRELVEDARLLAIAGHPDRALQRVMQVFQLPEADRPTVDAICYLLVLRATTTSHIAFTKLRLARQGLLLTNKYGTPEHRDLFEDIMDSACEYIEHEFIGARYRHVESGQEWLVLDVANRGKGRGRDAVWVATIQDSVGDIEMETAGALSNNPDVELIESGNDFDPRTEACTEGEHEFKTDDLRRHQRSAVCSRCNLTNGALSDWFGHNVPEVCPNCNSVVRDIKIRPEGEFCENCTTNSH